MLYISLVPARKFHLVALGIVHRPAVIEAFYILALEVEWGPP